MKSRIQNVKPKEFAGISFRSSLEADTARMLMALHLPFSYEGRRITLLEGFHCPYQKEKVRPLTYTPDFEVGSIMIECKGFETPEWRIKKKYLFQYLMHNEPDVCFYQIHDSRKSLLQALDNHWPSLGLAVQVSSQKRAGRKQQSSPAVVKVYSSIQEAMQDLGLQGKSMGSILKSLTGQTDFTYGYNWRLIPAPSLPPSP